MNIFKKKPDAKGLREIVLLCASFTLDLASAENVKIMNCSSCSHEISCAILQCFCSVYLSVSHMFQTEIRDICPF